MNRPDSRASSRTRRRSRRSACLSRSVTVHSAKTVRSPRRRRWPCSSSCCSETIFCCRVRISSSPVRSPTWARRGYSWPPKLRWLILPSGRAVEQGAVGLQLPDPLGRLLGVQLGHPPVVEELAAAHGVAEVDLPVVVAVDVAHARRDAALGHDRVRLAEQGLADDGRALAGLAGLDGRAQPGAAGADDEDVVLVALDLGRSSRRRSRQQRPCQFTSLRSVMTPGRHQHDVDVGDHERPEGRSRRAACGGC